MEPQQLTFLDVSPRHRFAQAARSLVGTRYYMYPSHFDLVVWFHYGGHIDASGYSETLEQWRNTQADREDQREEECQR